MSTISVFEGIHRYFVYCPGGVVTGGPELLHQLVIELVGNGVSASIVYYPTNIEWTTPARYKRYGCPLSRSIEDDSHCAIIVPEVATHLLSSIKAARRCIWWLSVDNYRGNFESFGSLKLYLKRLIKSDVGNPNDVVHLCQSYYAAEFIRKRFGVTGIALSDYLAEEFFDGKGNTDNKADIVLYNPRKGIRATEALKKRASHFLFKPLSGMSREQMRSALNAAKVYVDFGSHPGKDRIPREAAVSGCVVICGKRGSAKNAVDIPIPSRYKFGRWQLNEAVSLIADVFDDYPKHFAAQSRYREGITHEHEVFSQEVKAAFVR